MAGVDPITEIHQAIEPLLRPYFAERRWHIEPVPWPMTQTEFQRLLGVTPWIGLHWEKFTPDANCGRRLKGAHQMRLTLCVKNAGGRATRLLGDRLGPGLFPSLTTAAAVLHGRALPGIGTLAVGSVEQSYNDGYGGLDIAIGTLTFSCHTLFGDTLGAVAEAPEFAQLVSTFEVDPPREDGLPVTTTTDLGT
ncbi:hypothetical protein K9U40_10285 [Xanthobacter autotrophicus]|uniref:hypothetical protein n=1 Tax=Xanthobacter TaxID=279 RepID=UPI0024AC3853|nr:hypothetical protein [Xanthobacter autotrophicus]MDI4664713.1 hypothetical protein [Xanthobacter autotrophicus]